MNTIWRYFKEIYSCKFTYEKRNDLNLIYVATLRNREVRRNLVGILFKALFFTEPPTSRSMKSHSIQCFKILRPHKVKTAVIFYSYFLSSEIFMLTSLVDGLVSHFPSGPLKFPVTLPLYGRTYTALIVVDWHPFLYFIKKLQLHFAFLQMH